MKRVIDLKLDGHSGKIIIQSGSRHNFLPKVKENSLLITDSNVSNLYNEITKNFNTEIYPAGEENKNIENVINFCRRAAQLHLDRKATIYALGGGVCGDMAGFAAAIYMRGCNLVQMPTTLLAMVDSSVGGKTAVDIAEGKNLVGAFHQAQEVLIDPEFLDSLPRREICCGMAEIVKTAVILDKNLFELLEQTVDNIDYAKVIERCCQLKAYVVEQDEKEKSLRAILNYGHTFGHALELKSNYTIPHGEAVSVGMIAAGELALKLNLWSCNEQNRQRKLLERIGLMVSIKGLNYSATELLEAMRTDKKNLGGKIRVVLPVEMGLAKVFDNVSEDMIISAWEDVINA